MSTYSTRGIHLLLDIYWDTVPDLLSFAEEVETGCNLHVIKTLHHHFTPQGQTYLALLAESHFSIHTYPEHKYWSVDLYTCGSNDYRQDLARIIAKYEPRSCAQRAVNRGLET